MSEVGIISKQYEQLVSTIDDINAAVVTLKKAFLCQKDPEKYTALQVSDNERDITKNVLVEFLDFLSTLFEKRGEPNYRFVPEKVFDKFKGSLIEDADLKGVIKTIRKSLQKGELPDEKQFELLDGMVNTLDIERNKLSIKIRSARG